MDTQEEAPETAHRKNVERIGRALARMVANWPDAGAKGAPAHKMRNALAARDREHFVTALAHAIGQGWVIRRRGSDILFPNGEVPGEGRLGLVAELDAAGAYTPPAARLRS